ILIALFYAGLRYTRKKHYVLGNNIILCLLFIFIGFSSWIMLPVRSNAGTIINENSPQNARELLAYYNREQYPDNPLFYGPQFTDMFAGLDENNPYLDGKPKYEEDHDKGKYVIVNNYKNSKPNSRSDQDAFIPRMSSTQTQHMINYMNLTGPVEYHLKPEEQGNARLRKLVQEVKSQYAQGNLDNGDLIQFFKRYSDKLDIEKPSTSANLQFMFQYDFWYMYFRYFLWNFVGRQDDTQGKMTNLHGNWMSGITPIDSMFFGSQKNLPDDVKHNPARNTYYF